MKILILGGDGYLGWPTAMHLSRQGHQVAVVDNYFRRSVCKTLAIPPLIQVGDLQERAGVWNQKTGRTILTAVGDITDYKFLKGCFSGTSFINSGRDKQKTFSCPDAVIHYAEQPSAPYSMIGRDEAAFTLQNNLIGTLHLIHAVRDHAPNSHIIKLGTMGAYGTPNIDIEEGYLTVEHKGRTHTFSYPKSPGSLYHVTKAQDSEMLSFYCRAWNIRVTDLNQGPVYGMFTNESKGDERLATILNYDGIFGTVLNRFICQAVSGYPLTVYGKGEQKRGYINIKDTLQCILLAAEKPAQAGEFRVFNQFTETFSINELAEKVRQAGTRLGLDTKVVHLENPRIEAEEHYYNPVHTGLMEIGLQPTCLTNDVLIEMMQFVQNHADKINPDLFAPTVQWK